MGGTFYVSVNRQYLFADYNSDLSGLTVYDLNQKLILFSGTIAPYLGDWYYKDGKYFAETWNSATDKIDSNQIAMYDFTKNKLTIEPCSKDYLIKSRKLSVYNYIEHDKRCNCGQ